MIKKESKVPVLALESESMIETKILDLGNKDEDSIDLNETKLEGIVSKLESYGEGQIIPLDDIDDEEVEHYLFDETVERDKKLKDFKSLLWNE